MKSRTRSTRLLLGAAAVFATVVLGACTPNEIAVFNSLGPDQQQAVLNHLAAKDAASNDKFRHVVSDAGLARLRACESGGNYRIVSASGTYRGAYQFNRGTWNGVAARHYPQLRGVDPAAASPADQDRMARALWSERGRQPWPHCGRRV